MTNEEPMMTTTTHAKTNCPLCQYPLAAAASFKGEIPAVGDISICINCGAVLTCTDEALHLRLMTPAEIQAFDPDELDAMKPYVFGWRLIEHD